MIATVFGDVHDIGKSLVNTILTNNGYTVIDLGKQVPVEADPRRRQGARCRRDRPRALLVSTSKQMPICIRELHATGIDYPVLIGGAAINRDFGRRALYPGGSESDEIYEPGVFFCKDAFQGLDDDGRSGRARRPGGTRQVKLRAEALAAAPEGPPGRRRTCRQPRTRRSGLTATHRYPMPEPPFWGVREIPIDLDEVYPHLDPTCCSSSIGAAAGSRVRIGRSCSTKISARASNGCGPSRTT